MTTLVRAESYPTKPVRIVVGAAAGGGFDIAARLLADRLSQIWGQPVIIDNRSGAGHVVATELVSRAEPDGYTLLVVGANHVLNPLLLKKLPYDTEKDFVPVILWGKTPFILEVNPALPVKSVQELVAFVQSQKGGMNYTASQLNSSSHVAGELFKQMAKIDMTFVPYRGSAPALQDVLANRVSVMFDAPVSSMPLIEAGQLRPLAVTSSKRDPALPDIPTMAEAGFPGFEIVAWIGLAAPAGTPSDIVKKLNSSFAAVLAEPGVRGTLAKQGWVVETGSPESLGAFIRTEIEHYRGIVRAANLQGE
jgi:tripartite-type tricarboxylate transporter receptor subunit TctC